MATSSPLAPVVATSFDCAAFYALTETRNSNTAALIRMVHSAISPTVTHAAIAKRLTEFDAAKAESNNVAMTVGHFAQTAALALCDDTREHFEDDESLTALYRIRTTGTAESRRAMVKGFGGQMVFTAYVAAWAKDTRAAKTAAGRTPSTGKATPAAKAAPKNAPTPDVSIAAIPAVLTLPELTKALSAHLSAYRTDQAESIVAYGRAIDEVTAILLSHEEAFAAILKAAAVKA